MAPTTWLSSSSSSPSSSSSGNWQICTPLSFIFRASAANRNHLIDGIKKLHACFMLNDFLAFCWMDVLCCLGRTIYPLNGNMRENCSSKTGMIHFVKLLGCYTATSTRRGFSPSQNSIKSVFLFIYQLCVSVHKLSFKSNGSLFCSIRGERWKVNVTRKFRRLK